MGYKINLCYECKERADYAEFLISRPGRTVQGVSECVDPPDCKESPQCNWKEKWIGSALGKVERNGQFTSSAPGPVGREKEGMLPKGWMLQEDLLPELWISRKEVSQILSEKGKTKQQLLMELRRKREHLNNKLLESLILDKNVSKGMSLLEDLEDIIISMEQNIQEDKDCKAEDETTSEKQESPTMIIGKKSGLEVL
jgi:hypothetical protein